MKDLIPTLTEGRQRYERELFTEPIAALKQQIKHLRQEYDETVRDFIPDVTRHSARCRELVPVVCSVYSTCDAQDEDELYPWDVLGGVITALFTIPTVERTVDEYEEWPEGTSCKEAEPLRVRLSNTRAGSHTRLTLWNRGQHMHLTIAGRHAAEILDVSALEGIVGLDEEFFILESNARGTLRNIPPGHLGSARSVPELVFLPTKNAD